MSKLANPFSSVADWFRPGSDGGSEASGPVAVETRPREDQQPTQGGGWFFRKRNQKKQNLAQLQRGYEDVVDLMESCKSHMESQAQRADRLLELLEDLPEALRVIPESSRQQAKMIEGLQSHLENQSSNTERLTDAVAGLATATHQHEQAMGAIQKQLDANQQNGARMVESFSALGDTLGRIGAAHQSGNDLLNTMAETVKQSDDEMRELFTRNQRQATVMSLVSWTLAISALLVAGYIGVKVSQMPIGVPVAAAPAVTDIATDEASAAAATASTPKIVPASAAEAIAEVSTPGERDSAAASSATTALVVTNPAEPTDAAIPATDADAEAEAWGITVESVLADELIHSTPAADEAGEATASDAAVEPSAMAGERPYIGDVISPEMQAWMQQTLGPWVDRFESAAAGIEFETASAE